MLGIFFYLFLKLFRLESHGAAVHSGNRPECKLVNTSTRESTLESTEDDTFIIVATNVDVRNDARLSL